VFCKKAGLAAIEVMMSDKPLFFIFF